MNALTLIKRLIPQTAKRFIKSFRKQDGLLNLIAPNLPNCICIDVGASYYPHPQWELFRHSKNTQWIAVEPNEKNIAYIKSWKWNSNVKAVTTGLSRDGGVKTLYVTNVDSGSSLLKPEILDSMKHRVKKRGFDYLVKLQPLSFNHLTQILA